MKISKYLFAFFLVSTAFSSANAQGKISLESVVGEIGQDTLTTGQEIAFNIYFQNGYTESNVTEFIHTFKISSDDGAVWTNAEGSFENNIESFYDIRTIDDATTTGFLIDTITFSGLALQQEFFGAPPLYEEVAFRITIGPFDSADHGKHICLDSAVVIQGESWLWVLDAQETVDPAWDGPHCFTIVDPNQLNSPPSIIRLDDVAVNETETVNLDIFASDPNQDFVDIVMSNTDLPASAVFDPLPNQSGQASLTWVTGYDDSGTYFAEFTATDSMGGSDIDMLSITVNNVNRAPVITPINDTTISENQQLVMVVTATDDDGDALRLEFESQDLIPLDSFVDNGNGTGTLTWTPTFDEEGVYNIIFLAFDDSTFVQEMVVITVGNSNQPPVLDPITTPVVFVENQFNGFDVTGSDPDGDNFTFSIDFLPTGAIFEANDGGFGFSWTPDFDQQGSYDVWFYIIDDFGATDSQLVTLVVTDVGCSDLSIASFSIDGPQQISYGREFQQRINLTLENLGPVSVDSQFTLNFFSSHGEDGTYFQGSQTVSSLGLGLFDIEITDSVVMNPDAILGPAYLLVQIEESGFLDCNTQNNVDSIPFELVDNIPSVLDSIGNQEVNEGETLGILLTASDADGDQLEFDYIWHEEVYPNNFSFTDSGNGVAYFEVTPNFGDQGVYDIEFIVQDFYGFKSGGGSFDFEQITITVNEVNRAPQIDTLQDTMFVNENDLLQFGVSTFDPDGDCMSLDMFSLNLPQEAQFFNNSECGTNGDFSWQTDFDDDGIYSAFFVVSDGDLADTELVTIIVQDVPCADLSVAAFSIDGPQQISYGREFQQRINLTIENLGPVSVDSQFTLNFFSSHGQQGTYFQGSQAVSSLAVGQFVINLTSPIIMETEASDGPAFLLVNIEQDGFIDCDPQNNLASIPFELVYNIEPILDSIGNKSVDEGQTLSFVVTAVDWDNDQLLMDYFQNSESSFEIIFEDSGNGHAYFEWTPGFNDAGEYSFEFYVYDGQESQGDFEEITITVNEFNRNPVIDSLIDTMYVDENKRIDLQVSAADPDDDCFELYFESPDLPQTALFDYVFDCVDYGDFSWTPGYGDAGTYHAIFIVDDQNGGFDEDTVVIVVNNINAPPALADVPFQSVDENQFLTFQISATDIDNNLSSIYTGSLPPGATFTYSGGGSATIEWTPDCNQSTGEGSYEIDCYAVDDSGLVDTNYIYIGVGETCDQPLTVVTTPCVQCSPPQFYTDILPSESVFEIEFNNIIEQSSISENISITSVRDDYLDYNYNAKNRTIEIYSYYGYFAPVDTIVVTLNTGIFDLSETSLDSNYSLTYTVGPVVYPGDCNNNGVVDEVDVLSIGLYWNNQGPDRENDGESDPLEFYAQPAHFQQQGKGQWSPNNGIYSDVNGDGIVDANDLCGIAINFGETVFEDRTPAKESFMMNPEAAAKEIGSKVLEEMRDALIECPDSRAKEMMLSAIENALNASGPLLPKDIVLNQNYPNPFNPSTTIEFYLPIAEKTKLEIFNMLGQRVLTLVDEKVEAGYKTVLWHGTDYTGQSVASGIYFYRLTTESKEIIKRMLLVK